MDEFSRVIRSWSARYRLQGSLYVVFFGLAGGLAAALILAILARLYPILHTSTLIALATTSAFAGALAGFLWPWLRTARRSQTAWARLFDHQFRLKERISTALELREGIVVTHNESMRRNQGSDALQAAGSINIRKLLPLRVSMRAILSALALALALTLAVALPNPQDIVLANRAQLQQAVQEQLQQLESARQQVQQSQALDPNQKKQIVQALEDAQKALSDPASSPEKSLAAINDAQAKLDALRNQAFQNQVSDLQRAGQSLAPDSQTNALASALENSQLQQAADAMRNLAQNGGKPLDATQRQSVANQLDQIANSVQRSDQATAQQLRQAAQNLRQQNDQAAQAALNKAADSLEKAAQKQSVEQQIQATQSSIENARRAISAAQQSAQSGQPGQGNLSSGNQPVGAAIGKDGSPGQSRSGSQPTGQRAGGQDNTQASIGNSLHSQDIGTDNSVLNPSRITTPGQNIVLPDANARSVTDPNAAANPGVSNQASVPYQQVYAQYAKTADDAIQGGAVPAGMRDYVREYFSSLDPKQAR